VFVTTLLTQLCIKVSILLTRGQHLHNRIISLRGVRAHNTRLTQSHIIACTKPGERGRVFVLGVSVIFLLDFGIVSIVWLFILFKYK
jgi:hypothetical protein